VWQLFHPSFLRIIQSLLQPIDYDLIYSLGLPVSLRVGRSGISVRYPQVATVSPEGLTIKLKAIVQDKGMRDSESSNDVPSDEYFCIHVPNIGQGLGLDPFGEVVCVDYQVSFVSCCFRERAYNIQALLSERPRTGEGIEDPSWLVDIWNKPLALITFLGVFLGLFLHTRPPVSLSEGSVCQRSSSCMTPANSLMQLFE